MILPSPQKEFGGQDEQPKAFPSRPQSSQSARTDTIARQMREVVSSLVLLHKSQKYDGVYKNVLN